MICDKCGQRLGEDVRICPICKSKQQIVNHEKYSYKPRSRKVAGILQILFGGFGIGRFYLGYNRIALGQLFTFPIFFIGGIWGFVDGILILCGQIDCDVNGVPIE